MKTNLLARTNINNYLANLKCLQVLFVCFNCMWLNFSVSGQNVNTYDFTAFPRTFSSLTLAGGATAVPAVVADESISGALPIGFDFNYAGTDYNLVYAGSNGFLAFTGASPLPNNDLEIASLGSLALIAPLWDGDMKGVTASSAYYQTTGTTGSRVFTFQWTNWVWFDGAPAISFQVKLYEGAAGKIEFAYRREANLNTFYGTASIGLAGPSPGSPDFLALNGTGTNPTVNYTLPNSGHRERPATGQVYAFTKSALKDLKAVELATPLFTVCGPNQTVSVKVKNTGAVPLDFSANPLSITGNITGPTPLALSGGLNTGTLGVNATQTVVVATNYNMSTPGTYTFNAVAKLTGDNRAYNDTIPETIRTVAPIATLPQQVNFTGYNGTNLSAVFPDWQEASPGNFNWENATGLGTAANTTAKMQLYGNFRRGWITGPKVTPTATTELRFKAAITDAHNFNPDPAGMAGTDDIVQVMVSTDCGSTFTPIHTYNASNFTSLTNVLVEQTFPLGAYAGQNIIVAFYASDEAIDDLPNYDFHIDDIFIGTPPAADLAVMGFVTPPNGGCYSNAENIIVTIKNYGIDTLKFASTNSNIKVKVTNGTNTFALNNLLTSSYLVPGATQNVTVTPALNMLPAGTYNFTAYSEVPGDNNKGNDTIRTSRTVLPSYSLPQILSFNGITNTSLGVLYPGWKEAKGAQRQVNGSDWAGLSGLGSSTNITAVVQFAHNTAHEWIIGPRILPAASTELRLKVAITDRGSFNPDPVGMAGTDDKVQVMVSTDCGVTYSPIYTFNATTTIGLSNVLTSRTIPLSAYAGQEIIIAFYATDGPIDDSPEYYFHLDDISILTPSGEDIGVTALKNPPAGACYGNAEALIATVKNFGTSTLNFATANADVTVKVSGQLTQTISKTITTGTLLPGDSMDVNMNVALNMAAPGAYYFKAFTSLAADNLALNDTVTATRLVSKTVSIPSNVNFTGFTGANLNTMFPDWYEAVGLNPQLSANSQWREASSTQITGFGSAVARVIFSNTSTPNNEWLVGPKFMATSATHLKFKAAVTGTGNMVNAVMNDNDTVFIMVSTDCGATFRKFSSVQKTSILTNAMKQFDVNLGALAGQQVIVAFNARHGSPRQNLTFSFHLDDIEIRNMFATDLRPVVLKAAKSGCGLTANENVCVVVKNEGITAQTNIPVGFRLSLNGTPGSVVNETVPGPIAPGDTLRYCFTNKLNLAANGNYLLQVFTKSTADGFMGNDTIAKIIASNNAVTITAPNVSRCGPGAVNLTASTPNNVPVNWYASASAVNPLATGPAFSPNLTANTTYYLEPATGIEKTGKPAFTSTGTNLKTTAGSQYFNATQPFIIKSVVVYTDLAAGGNITINLWAPNGTTPLQTKTFMLPAVTGRTAVTVPLDFPVPAAGNGYRLEKTNGLSIYRDTEALNGSHFPISSPSGIVSFYDGNGNDYYYFFYDWTITTSCTSARLPVTATINAVPTVNLGADVARCGSSPVVLNAGNPGATYQWKFNNAVIPGATNQTLTVNSSGNYIALVTTAGNCTASDTIEAVFNTLISKPTITPSGPTTFCNGGSVVLNGATATSGVTFSWLLNSAVIPGVSSAAYPVNVSGNYQLVATLGAGCADTSSVIAVTVNPIPATPVITQTGNVLTSSAAAGNQWYLGGNLIPGATASSFTPTASGNYTVVVTANGCASAVSNTISFVTGISMHLDGTSVTVYPNPCRDGNFHIQLKGYNKDAVVSLYSLTGQELKTLEIKAGQETTRLEAGKLPAGIYLLKVTSENRVRVLRVLVE